MFYRPTIVRRCFFWDNWNPFHGTAVVSITGSGWPGWAWFRPGIGPWAICFVRRPGALRALARRLQVWLWVRSRPLGRWFRRALWWRYVKADLIVQEWRFEDQHVECISAREWLRLTKPPFPGKTN